MSFVSSINTNYTMFDVGFSVWKSDKSKYVLVTTSGDCYGELSSFIVLTDLNTVIQDFREQ